MTARTGSKAIWSAVAEARHEPATPLSHGAACLAVGEARRWKRDAGMDAVATLGLSKSGVAGLRPLPPRSKSGMKTDGGL